MIYADNAATTRLSPRAREAMLPFLDGIYANPSSLHSPGQAAKEALEKARETIAGLLGCRSREIYFTSGGSESDNQAILSAAHWGERQGKRHIISTAFEHHAVLHTLKKLEKQGFSVTYLDVGEKGLITAEQVEKALRPDTCLVSVMYANNEIGTVQPVDAIGELCRERGVLFHCDAVQAAGQLPIDLSRQKIDLLSLSAHKFHGPKGAGILYARRGVPLVNLIEGGAQESGRRPGTENLAAIAGMAAALEEALENREENNRRLRHLRDRLAEGLSKIPHSVINGDMQQRLPGNLNLCFEGIEGESLLLLLDDMGICASSGSACTSGSLDPSHVLLAIGRPHEIAHGSLRLSLSPDLREEDIDYMIEAIGQVVARLRGMSPLWRAMENGEKPHILN